MAIKRRPTDDIKDKTREVLLNSNVIKESYEDKNKRIDTEKQEHKSKIKQLQEISRSEERITFRVSSLHKILMNHHFKKNGELLSTGIRRVVFNYLKEQGVELDDFDKMDFEMISEEVEKKKNK